MELSPSSASYLAILLYYRNLYPGVIHPNIQIQPPLLLYIQIIQ